MSIANTAQAEHWNTGEGICWQPLAANQWLLVPGAALAEHVRPPDPGSGDGPGMFAFADPDRLRPILAAAGWRDVEITSEQFRDRAQPGPGGQVASGQRDPTWACDGGSVAGPDPCAIVLYRFRNWRQPPGRVVWPTSIRCPSGSRR